MKNREPIECEEAVLLRSAIKDLARLAMHVEQQHQDLAAAEPDTPERAERAAQLETEFKQSLSSKLREGLLGFHLAQVNRRTTELLLPKLVARYAEAGAPKSNSSRGPSAYEKAGADVGVKAKTAQNAYRDFPPDSEED